MIRLNFRTVFWAVIIALLGLFGVYALLPKPVDVDMAVAVTGPMQVTVSDQGYTRVRDVYVVSAPVAGRLLRVEAKAGDPLEAGAVIANILPSDPAFLDTRTRAEAEAALHAAEAALSFSAAELDRTTALAAFARTEEERLTALFEGGIASQGAYDRVRMELRAAEADERTARAAVRMREADLEAAQARLGAPHSPDNAGDAVLDVMAIRTPVSGRVLRVLQESESVVLAGTPILEAGDPVDLEIVVELLSTDAVQVEQGAPVGIHGWGETGSVLRAVVRRVEPFGFLKVSALGVEEQRVNVILDLLDDPGVWSGLGHGFRVEAEIVVWSEEDVLQIPVSAVFRHGGDWAVFVLEEGRARRRIIEAGRANGEMIAVQGGLQAGQRVVLYPGERVGDGVRLSERRVE